MQVELTKEQVGALLDLVGKAPWGEKVKMVDIAVALSGAYHFRPPVEPPVRTVEERLETILARLDKMSDTQTRLNNRIQAVEGSRFALGTDRRLAVLERDLAARVCALEPSPKPGTFAWALEEMQAGRRVRRPGWEGGYTAGDTGSYLTVGAALATDWESA